MSLLDVIERTVEGVEPTLEAMAAWADATTARLERMERRLESFVGPLEELAAFAADSREAAAAFRESPLGKMMGKRADKAKAKGAE